MIACACPIGRMKHRRPIFSKTSISPVTDRKIEAFYAEWTQTGQIAGRRGAQMPAPTLGIVPSSTTTAELGAVATMPPRHAGPPLMVALAWALLAWSTPVTAAPKDAIRAFVERVNEASVSFFSSGSEADARERCRTLLAWAFDVPTKGKEALGRAWGKADNHSRGRNSNTSSLGRRVEGLPQCS
jgi:hypothetical protein